MAREMELSETTQLIFDKVNSVNPARIVFDSLSEMRLLAQSPLRYRRQILAVKHFFAGRRSTVVLLDDLSSHGNDLQLHSIVHGVIDLEQLALDYGAERRRLRVVKMRGRKFRGGYHDFTIETGGLKVFPRLVAAEHHKPFIGEYCSSGNAELDALIGGGLERGTSALLIGGAGVGKSSITLTYAVAAAERGESATIFAFDEGLGTLFARAEGFGIPLQKHVESGQIVVRQIDPAELSPGEFAHIVRQCVETGQTRLVLRLADAGRPGQRLKTLVAMPFVLDGSPARWRSPRRACCIGSTLPSTRSASSRRSAIGGGRSSCKTGTEVKVRWPILACSMLKSRGRDFYKSSTTSPGSTPT